MQVNEQESEPILEGTGESLDIQEIFWTIQGEGVFSGLPAVFIRTAGCQLACPNCDSDYTSKRQIMPIDQIIAIVKVLSSKKTDYLVVITGGEPLRQPIGNLAKALLFNNYQVQIETNGAAYQDNVPFHSKGLPHQRLWVHCSPKTPKLNEYLVPHIDSYKYVLDHAHIDPDDGLPTRVLGNEFGVARPPYMAWYVERNRIYVQPADVQDEKENELNNKAVAEVCHKFGYRVSLQLHKYLGLP